MIIAIDFDGTCVSHAYPRLGKDIGAVPVLRELTDAGHKLILYTMRDGELLKAAEDWFRENKIPLLDVNRNRQQVKWTSSPKVYADLYIDDAAVGCPVKYEDGERHRYVDWKRLRQMQVDYGLLE